MKKKIEDLDEEFKEMCKRLKKVEERVLILSGMINTFIQTAAAVSKNSNEESNENEDEYEADDILRMPDKKDIGKSYV